MRASSQKKKKLNLKLFQADNDYSSDEKAAYQQLLTIHSELSSNIKNEQAEAAKNLADFAKEQKFYRDLEYSGKFLNEKRFYRYPPVGGGSFWFSLSSFVIGLSLFYGHRKAFYIITALTFIFSLIVITLIYF